MKILVLGSGGMLGHTTVIYLKSKGHEVDNLSFPEKAFEDSFVCDVTDTQRLSAYLEDKDYDIIVNCIALLINASEENKVAAVWLNSYFPHWLEKEYQDGNTKIIQVSTDGVFGNGNPPYGEDAPHLNKTFYARSKSLGELQNEKDLTLRSSYFGPDRNENGKGLLNWFFAQSGEIKGFTKAKFTGVTSLEFARFVEIYGSSATGIYNLGAKEPISKYDLLELFRKNLSIDSIKIQPDDRACVETSVKTARSDIGYQPVSYEEMITDLCAYMKENKKLYKHYNFL